MIGRRSRAKEGEVIVEGPKGFDDYALRLGDVLRGERATMGKSLLDVQRELRIKAAYIAAIENCDAEAFETPGFIAGYVRSYARYLDMDPDATFAQFCAESGFSSSHGMDEAAKGSRKTDDVSRKAARARAMDADPFVNPALPFTPKDDGFLSRVEPGAIGSMTVLVALIGALGYGGWTVLQEIQRVQVAPVDQTPIVLSEIDPLEAAAADPASSALPALGASPTIAASGAGVFAPPAPDGLDRLYRPQALDVPVLIARDAPISSLDPNQFGAFAEAVPSVDASSGDVPSEAQAIAQAQTLADGLHVVAVRPAWVRLVDQGEVLYTGNMAPGQTIPVPQSARDPVIEVGESGAIYFAVNGDVYGPAGPRGTVNDIALQPEVLVAALPKADLQADSDLSGVMSGFGVAAATTPVPHVLDNTDTRVTVVAAGEAWVRVRSTQGNVLFEGVLQPGEFYTVPATEEAPIIRAGNAGAVYFATAGDIFGPFGNSGAVEDNLALSTDSVQSTFAVAEIPDNSPVARAVAELRLLEPASAGE